MAACLTAGRTKPPCDTLISGGVKEIYMVGRSQDDTIAVMALAACQCGLVVIHVENNGNTYIWGADETEEALLLNSNGDSGTLKSDPNQEEVFIQAIATKKARTFTGTIPV